MTDRIALSKHKLSDAELMNEFSASIDKFWGDVNSVLACPDSTDEQKSRIASLYEMARRFHNLMASGGKRRKI